METAAAIYNHLGNLILSHFPIEEGRILVRIEYAPGAQGYQGIYVTEAGQSMGLPFLPSEEVEAVEQLHRLTTAGGNNQWNLLYFTLMPGGAFEIDFVQDQDTVTSMAYLTRTRKMSDTERRQAYQALMVEMAQARAARLFAAMSGRLPALVAPWLPDWQCLVVRAERYNGDIFGLEGFAYSHLAQLTPTLEDEAEMDESGEEFSVVQDWEIVKQFYEFNTDDYQPSWNRLEWTVRPDGTYSLVFDWDTIDDPTLPLDVTKFPYTHEGHWRPLT